MEPATIVAPRILSGHYSRRLSARRGVDVLRRRRVAKGAAGATLLTKADRDPAVDDCQLIYDLDTKPAVQLTDKWPSLPEAVRVTSESGEQLLTAARERTGQIESMQSPCEGTHDVSVRRGRARC